MDTFLAFDWSTLPTAPFPIPDPSVFDADSWHPPDYERGFGFSDYPAAPTLSRVAWMGFDQNTPAATVDENTWFSTVEAYRSLPHPQAVESIILGHVPYLQKTVYRWVAINRGDDALRLEQRGRCALLKEWAGHKTKMKGGATIGEDLFSVGLLKLVKVVPSLRKVGKRYNWDELEVPCHIGKYLGQVVKNAIRDYLNREKWDHERILEYLQTCHPFLKAGRIKRGEIDDVDQVSCNGSSYVAFHMNTPDQEAAPLDALTGACEDIFDRLLLTMRREGVLTQAKMGKELGLTRSKVQRRLYDIRKRMEKDLGLLPKKSSKRSQRHSAGAASADAGGTPSSRG